MDKRMDSSSGCCDFDTVVAATPTFNSKHIQEAGGNSSPKLAATFQGMSVTSLHSASGGIYILPNTCQDAQAAHATAVYGKQATAMVKQHNDAKHQKSMQSSQLTTEQSGSASSRMKLRNKSEEAITDLLQRIPDIGHIFDVHSRIGNGTFSTVLLATLRREAHLPDSMRRKFAIKHHVPTSHPDRIMKELQCMTDMGGMDNVVGIHCCLRCEASAAFVMPYMPHDRFHEFYTKMDVAEIRIYMRNLLVALRHVHKFNVIHRDVKPSNFLYNRRQGQFLLVDFGLAQHVNLSAAAQLQCAPQDLRRCNAGVGGPNSKRPREREGYESAAQQHQQQQQQLQQQQQMVMATTSDAALGGVAKRMRLFEETTANSWNKMPLKPVNEIAQSIKAAELAMDEAKQQTDANAVQITGQQQVSTPAQAAAAVMGAQPEPNAATGSKYNTNRNAASNAKCFCFANPSVCINCLMKKEVHASRAGTPGYRPPEVLLKYADQTTAVDIWAAGVIFLSVLSSVYPFFKAPNDYVALAEIVTIFGDRAIRKTALALERMVTISHRSKPLNLRKLCLRFRHRLIFSDVEMVRKYESPDGRCDVCKNCDQYFFNCLCEESSYVTEPLDPYECFPASAYDLLSHLLEINPHKRITAEEALNHPFFTEPSAIGLAAMPPKQMTRRRATKAPGSVSGAGTTSADEQLYPSQNKL